MNWNEEQGRGEACLRRMEKEQRDLSQEVARLSKQNDHYERALRMIAESPFCDYFHGITRALTEAERSYRTGVTDGHRAAASVARDALAVGGSAESESEGSKT